MAVHANLNMYFMSRKGYSRFHYSDIYQYAVAVMNYLDGDEEVNKKRDSILKMLKGFYQSPFMLYNGSIFRKRALIGMTKNANVFHRLEYIAYRFTAMIMSGKSNAGMTKRIAIVHNRYADFGEVLDTMQGFKNVVHENLMYCLKEYKVPIDLPMMDNSYDMNVQPVGFDAGRNRPFPQ